MDNNKKRFLEILKQSRGIISSACESVDMSRQTYYNWLAADPDFAVAVDEVQESMIDFVESKLMQKINGIECMTDKGDVYELPPSDTAIIFFLKTKGKKRGYVEKSEIDLRGNVALLDEPIVFE
jgi:hypothetical protein